MFLAGYCPDMERLITQREDFLQTIPQREATLHSDPNQDHK
jgi:hypothetical protein